MSNIDFEAWLNQTAPTIIAVPLFKETLTTVEFTVLDADRDVVDLTDYTLKFAAKNIDEGILLFNKSVSITDAVTGTASISLDATDLANAAECLGELILSLNGVAVDRVQFRFDIVDVVA